MKTCFHLWQRVVEFFLEWRTFQTKVIEKNKKKLFSITLLPESRALYGDNVEEYGRAGLATDDSLGQCGTCALHAG